MEAHVDEPQSDPVRAEEAQSEENAVQVKSGRKRRRIRAAGRVRRRRTVQRAVQVPDYPNTGVPTDWRIDTTLAPLGAMETFMRTALAAETDAVRQTYADTPTSRTAFLADGIDQCVQLFLDALPDLLQETPNREALETPLAAPVVLENPKNAELTERTEKLKEERQHAAHSLSLWRVAAAEARALLRQTADDANHELLEEADEELDDVDDDDDDEEDADDPASRQRALHVVRRGICTAAERVRKLRHVLRRIGGEQNELVRRLQADAGFLRQSSDKQQTVLPLHVLFDEESDDDADPEDEANDDDNEADAANVDDDDDDDGANNDTDVEMTPRALVTRVARYVATPAGTPSHTSSHTSLDQGRGAIDIAVGAGSLHS
ncbi:MAG: hypothetical protein MHM6MM_000713 [Cercozoa sp. M6MM]